MVVQLLIDCRRECESERQNYCGSPQTKDVKRGRDSSCFRRRGRLLTRGRHDGRRAWRPLRRFRRPAAGRWHVVFCEGSAKTCAKKGARSAATLTRGARLLRLLYCTSAVTNAMYQRECSREATWKGRAIGLTRLEQAYGTSCSAEALRDVGSRTSTPSWPGVSTSARSRCRGRLTRRMALMARTMHRCA